MDYKYKLSVCLCIKNEAKHIIEFIEHYIKQGVDHFYIINNNSSDNLEEILENSSYNCLITLIKDDLIIDINNAYSLTNGLMAIYNNNLYDIIKKESATNQSPKDWDDLAKGQIGMLKFIDDLISKSDMILFSVVFILT